MDWSVFLSSWMFELLHSGTGACRPFDRSRSWSQNGDLWQNSLCSIIPGPLPPFSLHPSEQQLTPLAKGTLQDPQVCSAQFPLELLLCLSVHKTLCIQKWFSVCFPLSCGAPALKPLWTSKPNALARGVHFSSWCQDFSLKSLPWGSELSILLESFCNIIIFQFVGCIVGRHETWLCCENTPSTSHCGFFVFE